MMNVSEHLTSPIPDDIIDILDPKNKNKNETSAKNANLSKQTDTSAMQNSIKQYQANQRKQSEDLALFENKMQEQENAKKDQEIAENISKTYDKVIKLADIAKESAKDVISKEKDLRKVKIEAQLNKDSADIHRSQYKVLNDDYNELSKRFEDLYVLYKRVKSELKKQIEINGQLSKNPENAPGPQTLSNNINLEEEKRKHVTKAILRPVLNELKSIASDILAKDNLKSELIDPNSHFDILFHDIENEMMQINSLQDLSDTERVEKLLNLAKKIKQIVADLGKVSGHESLSTVLENVDFEPKMEKFATMVTSFLADNDKQDVSQIIQNVLFEMKSLTDELKGQVDTELKINQTTQFVNDIKINETLIENEQDFDDKFNETLAEVNTFLENAVFQSTEIPIAAYADFDSQEINSKTSGIGSSLIIVNL
ncbi:MAG: hypothetical protein MHPSP_000975 [Paramarteilia canceri]